MPSIFDNVLCQTIVAVFIIRFANLSQGLSAESNASLANNFTNPSANSSQPIYMNQCISEHHTTTTQHQSQGMSYGESLAHHLRHSLLRSENTQDQSEELPLPPGWSVDYTLVDGNTILTTIPNDTLVTSFGEGRSAYGVAVHTVSYLWGLLV
ncbi:hypothetical protein NQ314_012727, partial [Rhamnusium bicolor]